MTQPNSPNNPSQTRPESPTRPAVPEQNHPIEEQPRIESPNNEPPYSPSNPDETSVTRPSPDGNPIDPRVF